MKFFGKFLQFSSKKREKFYNIYPIEKNLWQFLSKEKNFDNFYPKREDFLTIIPQKTANLDNFPFLKVKNKGKLFYNFFALWGVIIFWAEYSSMLISDHFLLLFPITSLRLSKLKLNLLNYYKSKEMLNLMQSITFFNTLSQYLISLVSFFW